MQLDSALSGGNDALLKAHSSKGASIVIVIIDAGQGAVFGEIIIRRIPHLCDRIVRIAYASVNLVLVRFPKAIVRLPAELAGRLILAQLDGIAEVLREVVTDLLEQR